MGLGGRLPSTCSPHPGCLPFPLTYLDRGLDTEGAPEPRASFPRASPSVFVAPSTLTCCPQLTSFVPQEAGELYNRMLKRFRQEKAVWVKYGAFLLRRGKAEASHRVMQRALECLPKKERECSFLPPTQFLSTVDSLHLGRGMGGLLIQGLV